MIKETIDAIRAAEAKAEELMANAQEQAVELENEYETMSDRLKEESKRRAAAYRDGVVSHARKTATDASEAARQEAQTSARAIQQRAEPNVAKAIAFVVTALTERS